MRVGELRYIQKRLLTVAVVAVLLGFCAPRPVDAAVDAPVVESLLKLRRERLVRWKQDIADLRKKAAAEATRAKSLSTRLAAKKKQLAAHKKEAESLAAERAEATEAKKQTSATLTGYRRDEAALAAHGSRLRAALTTHTLALHVAQSPEGVARRELAAHVTASRARAAERTRRRLADLIDRSEDAQDRAVRELADTTDQHRAADSKADKLAAQIAELEKELAAARKNREAHLSRVAQLGKLAAGLEKEIARLQAHQAQAAEPAKPAAEAPESPEGETEKPEDSKPSPPRSPKAPLPEGLKEGTGYNLMVEEGTAVHPIGAGRVIYAGRFPGYGKLAIVEHPDGVLSLYGFLNDIVVASGETVAVGQTLGKSGFIEDNDRAGLRFEMRLTRGGREIVVDPHSWLPAGAEMKRRLLDGTD